MVLSHGGGRGHVEVGLNRSCCLCRCHCQTSRTRRPLVHQVFPVRVVINLLYGAQIMACVWRANTHLLRARSRMLRLELFGTGYRLFWTI